ncbi:MAG: hypothetical protein IH830_03055 [Planctomycetes bacterium]|nr:hypothetical protein [Planctomycetota bacterium]
MKARVTFLRMIQDLHDFHMAVRDDDQMVSRLFFDLEIDGKQYDQLTVEVAQPMGTDYESEPITVAPLDQEKYNGPWNHGAFRDEAEKYYRQALSMGIGVGPGVQAVRMRDNHFDLEVVVEFDVQRPPVGWCGPPQD